MMQQKEGHGENGWKAPTNQNILQWIMLGLEDDALYITSKSHLFHKIGDLVIYFKAISIVSCDTIPRKKNM